MPNPPKLSAHTRALAGMLVHEPIYRSELEPKLRDVFGHFKSIEQDIKTCRKELDKRITDHARLNQQMELLEFWCDETEMLADEPVGTTTDAINERMDIIDTKSVEMSEKLANFKTLEELKNRFLEMPSVEKMEKHAIRRQVTQLGKRNIFFLVTF